MTHSPTDFSPPSSSFQSGWQVEGIRDGATFFQALHQILPSPSYLILYDDAGGLLQSYGAFDLPLLVVPSIPEPRLRVFCDALGITYTPVATKT